MNRTTSISQTIVSAIKLMVVLAPSMLFALPSALATAPESQSAADRAFMAGELDRAEQLYQWSLQNGAKTPHDLSRLGDINLLRANLSLARSHLRNDR
jgi:hypothetical protein